MADEKMFQEAVSAVRQGQRERARDLLTRLLRNNQGNPDYWVWMSAVVDSPKERVYCLQTALRIDPNNKTAKRGLILAGGWNADDVVPVPPPRRRWSTATEQTPQERQKPKGFAAFVQQLPPFLRATPVLIGGGVGVMLLAVFFLFITLRGAYQPPQPTSPIRTVGTVAVKPWLTDTPTPTVTPTSTPVMRSATPTLVAATPLWMLLPATYTATPTYIGTPHRIIQAYQLGLKAYNEGDYSTMLQRMQQAASEDPGAVDILYYVGEAYYLLGKYKEAFDTFKQVIAMNENFAPGYLGRARTQQKLDPKKDVGPDLDKAIEADPAYLDAYLERAAYRLAKHDPNSALEDLGAAEGLRPEHPLVFVLRAQAYLQLGDKLQALENAQRGLELDLTSLPAYLTLAQAYLANENYAEALKQARTYTLYDKKNADAWLIYGMTLYLEGKDYNAALKALDEAIALNKKLLEGYHYRGLTYLALDKTDKAATDLYSAYLIEPESFIVNLDYGRALIAYNRLNDGIRFLSAAKGLAETDAELAMVYYWRAQAYEKGLNMKAAVQEWEALLALPAEVVPQAWLELAHQHLLAMTPTLAVTATLPTTITPTGSAITRTFIGPPEQESTATPTATATATPKP